MQKRYMGTQVVHFPLSRKISSVLDKKPPGCFFCENEAVVVAWTTNSSPGRIFFLKEEEEEPTHPSNFAPSSSFHSFFSRTSYAAFPYTREKKLRGRKEGKQPPPPVAISHLSPTTHSFPFSFFLINHLLSPPFLFLFLTLFPPGKVCAPSSSTTTNLFPPPLRRRATI